MRATCLAILLLGVFAGAGARLAAQEFGPPDRGEPGDERIQEYLRRESDKLHASFAQDIALPDAWQQQRARYVDEYFYMLGLAPQPEKTPLEATVTGRIDGDGFTVEMLHYQSRPRLYVTANLYRPAKSEAGKRLPAVLYVCGHSGRGRNGNKTAFQSHGIWFARHGYVCLIVDTLQLGEIAATHHGTYNQNRWWWHSRGYTPAGVECWNGVRGIDYLVSRPDVDAERIAVTGISGGGAATFWVAAADERVRVAVPVSGMADLPAYVSNRVSKGHCDCMFLYNTFQWPWVRIAALVAPRPLLFANSDQDRIFPMDANERIINRLERIYSQYGATDRVDSLVSMGGHDYRQDLRQGIFRFLNTHLKDDPRLVTDSEVDLADGSLGAEKPPLDPVKLRAFPRDEDLPRDELNTTIDQHFVPLAKVVAPASGQFAAWHKGLTDELQRVVFRPFPERISPATKAKAQDAGRPSGAETVQLETEPGISVTLTSLPVFKPTAQPHRRLLLIRGGQPAGEKPRVPAWVHATYEAGDVLYELQPRGVGESRWTMKHPPNYVARAHVLLGRTVDAGRVWDVIAAARYLQQQQPNGGPIHVLGEGASGVLAAYAALWEPEIAGVVASQPPLSHMEPTAPALFNVLRVCDVPDVLGLLAPRPVLVYAKADERLQKTAAIFAAAEASNGFRRLDP